MLNRTARNTRNCPVIGVSLLCGLATLAGLCVPAYGQSIGELSTSMAVQGQLEEKGQSAVKRLANEPNAVIDANKPAKQTIPAPKPNVPAAGETPATPNKAVAGNAAKNQTQPMETNVPDINDFNSSQRELNRINIETKSEEQQWLGPLDRKKTELARAMEELVTAQLKFVRKIAETEHSEQTTKAIDLILKQRQERLDKLVTKLDEELKQERQQQAERRKTSRPGGQEQLPRERPQRKVPVNNAEGQQ